ncbi:hypothetical protein JCGZ_05956 [Jatropha curcas]|uniref:Uncharacterized protein n=1 Tax=Jatropha curcas TaxID=180498 RepID=A0A067KN03_JATCU|nr:hypothetical protein JCGZ_05956 [Jatropha curcas]
MAMMYQDMSVYNREDRTDLGGATNIWEAWAYMCFLLTTPILNWEILWKDLMMSWFRLYFVKKHNRMHHHTLRARFDDLTITQVKKCMFWRFLELNPEQTAGDKLEEGEDDERHLGNRGTASTDHTEANMECDMDPDACFNLLGGMEAGFSPIGRVVPSSGTSPATGTSGTSPVPPSVTGASSVSQFSARLLQAFQNEVSFFAHDSTRTFQVSVTIPEAWLDFPTDQPISVAISHLWVTLSESLTRENFANKQLDDAKAERARKHR